MGRKNNKNRNRNQKPYQNQQPRKLEREELEVIGTEKQDVVIEVIEPVMQQPVQTQMNVGNQEIKKEEKGEINSMPKEMGEKTVSYQQMPQQPLPQQVMYNQMPYGTVPTQQQGLQMPQQPTQQQVMYNQMPYGAVPTQQPMNQMPSQQPMNQMPYQQMPLPIVEQPVAYQQEVQPVMEEIVNEKIETNLPAKKIQLLITKNPKSSFSESIKSIRTNLQFASVEKEIKVILVSSPEPGDGKSLISSNLAGAYAQENKKVLIIDCDLRKGRQAEIFKVKKSPTTGYTNLILNYKKEEKKENKKEAKKEEKFNFGDYICETGIENMDLIPNGPTPPNPIELLSSSKNKELLEELKKIYDVIILDCPPVLGLSDALIMTKYSDANIIVISKGKTKVESLAEVKKSFEKINSTITGVITNKAKSKHNSYYGYYGK